MGEPFFYSLLTLFTLMSIKDKPMPNFNQNQRFILQTIWSLQFEEYGQTRALSIRPL